MLGGSPIPPYLQSTLGHLDRYIYWTAWTQNKRIRKRPALCRAYAYTKRSDTRGLSLISYLALLD